MSKRKYVKRSKYWDQFKGEEPIERALLINNDQEWSPQSSGENYYVATSDGARYSSSSGDPLTESRERYIAKSGKPDKFINIKHGLLPFEHSKEGISVRNAIELCQKAYANVAIFRNSIDIMS